MKVDPQAILRSGRPLPPCPDPALLSKKSARHGAEVSALADRKASLRDDVYALSETIERVKQEEADAGAIAARKGDPMPTSKVPSLEDEQRSKEAELIAVEQAERAALADYLGAIAEDADATNNRADAEVAKNLKAVLAAAEALEQGLDHLDRAFIARRWCASVALGEMPPRSKIAYSSSLNQPNGSPYTLRALVDVIRTGVAEMIETHGYDEPEGAA